MTQKEAQELINICIQYTNDEKGNKLTDWSIITFLTKLKVELEKIVKKDIEIAADEKKEKIEEDKK